MAKERDKAKVVSSSGNVFDDLGLAQAEEKQTKVRLAVAINQVILHRRLSQVSAARRLQINQPRVSGLFHYGLAGFSVERLMSFLNGSQ